MNTLTAINNNPSVTEGIQPVKPLRERAVLVSLSISRFSMGRADKTVGAEICEQHGAARTAGNFIKKFFDTKNEYVKKVINSEQRVRMLFNNETLPWGEKWRIMEVAKFFEKKLKFDEEINKHEACVKELAKNIENIKENEKLRLGTLYKEDDYPTEEGIKKLCNIAVSVVPMPRVEDFRSMQGISSEDMQKLQDQMDKQHEEQVNQARTEIYNRMKDKLSHFYKKMMETDKSFKKNTIDNVGKAAKSGQTDNVFGDNVLDDIANRMEELSKKSDPDIIRQDESYRVEMAEEAKKLIEEIDNQMAGIF